MTSHEIDPVVKVEIVGGRIVPTTMRLESPQRLSARSFTFPPAGMGSPVQSLAARNNARRQLVVRAPVANTAACFITDIQQANAAHGYQLDAGSSVTLLSTHDIYAWGTAGDSVQVIEESYND